jgi:hypothetical protein
MKVLQKEYDLPQYVPWLSREQAVFCNTFFYT